MPGKCQYIEPMSKAAQDQYNTDSARWNAVCNREDTADGIFFYGVITTGVYCYPSCASRGALRENVRFYTSRDAAVRDGLRPCKRCQSDHPPLAERHLELVEKACRLIEQSTGPARIETIATTLDVSRYHLQRVFKAHVGIGPKAYDKAVRAGRMSSVLKTRGRKTDAILEAGYETASRFYEDAGDRLGMPVKLAAQGAVDMPIRYDYAETSLGLVLIAVSERGLCSVIFGESKTTLREELVARFPKADIVGHASAKRVGGASNDSVKGSPEGSPDGSLNASLAHWLDLATRLIEQPALDDWQLSTSLPIDIQGTAFQEQVWQVLRRIPVGSTQSYKDIAVAIGKPKSSRAIAQACAANPLAVVLPCHRVVASSGKLSGYRWGVERKSTLLERESGSANADDDRTGGADTNAGT